MAELTAEINARFDQVNRELKVTAKSVDGLEREFKQAGAAAQVMDTQVTKAATAVTTMNRSAGKSSQIFFQAGQAISDFAVAGVLGAANNIEFLALQLGASGPLIAGITALSVAALVFRDDLDEAFSGLFGNLDEIQEKTKEVADSLISINRAIKVSFGGTLDELKRDSERVDEVVASLQKRLEGLRLRVGQAQTGTATGFTTFIPSSPEIERLKTVIESIEPVLARQLAIQESLNEKIAEEEVLKETIAALDGTTLVRKEEEVKKEKEKTTELDKAVELNNKLIEQLESLRDIDTSRLGQILTQNDALREQIKVVQRLNEERAKNAGALGISGLSTIGAGLSSEGAVTPIDEVLAGIAGRRKARQKNRLEARELDPELINEVAEATNRQADAIAEATARSEELAGVVRNNLTDAFSSFFEAIGSGDDPFTSLRASIGAFAIDMGKTLIGFGISGLAIKRFIANPATAIAAGAGLVVLGAALKKSAESKAAAFTGSSTSSSAATAIADPRQGRDGRFRRDTSQFESGYQPISTLADFRVPEFRFKLQGEDFVAGSDKTIQRQSRTRGTSPARSTAGARTSR